MSRWRRAFCGCGGSGRRRKPIAKRHARWPGHSSTGPFLLFPPELSPLFLPYGQHHDATIWECFLVIGPVEELVKFLAFLLAVRKEPTFDEPTDAIVFAAATALGFAFAENLFYFASLELTTITVRSVLSVPAHVLDAVWWGGAIGHHRFVPGTSRWVIAGGLAIAAFYHGLYDALAYNAKYHPFILLPMFGVVVWIQWRLYRALMDKAEAHKRALVARSAAESVAATTSQPQVAIEAACVIPSAEICAPGGAHNRSVQALKWQWIGNSFLLGLLATFLLGALALSLSPDGHTLPHKQMLIAIVVLEFFGVGLVTAYQSPGRTVREAALGLALCGALMGTLAGKGLGDAATMALSLAVLGGFGGWLGEALQPHGMTEFRRKRQ